MSIECQPGGPASEDGERLGAGQARDHPVLGDGGQIGEQRWEAVDGQGAFDVEGFLAPDEGFVLQQPAQVLDFLRRPFGEVGQGALFDFSAFAPAFAQKDGPRRPLRDTNSGERGQYPAPGETPIDCAL